MLMWRCPSDPFSNTKDPAPMKLYVTYTSPYARLARIVVVEKTLENRVEVLAAKTRSVGSPYYQINPSGRVPYLVDDAGLAWKTASSSVIISTALTASPDSTTNDVTPIGTTADSRLTRAACAKGSAYGCAK